MAKTVVLKKAAKKRRVVVNRDPVILTYRALAPMEVADVDLMDPEAGETTHTRRFGDYVPEAAKWKRIDTWLITKRIEPVHINQSELDRWWEEYRERIAWEDEEKSIADEEAREIAELERQLQERKARAGIASAAEKKSPNFNADPERRSRPLEEKIDLGGVSRRDGSLSPVELPGVTRAPLPQMNAGENRRRPTVVRKAVRRKA